MIFPSALLFIPVKAFSFQLCKMIARAVKSHPSNVAIVLHITGYETIYMYQLQPGNIFREHMVPALWAVNRHY